MQGMNPTGARCLVRPRVRAPQINQGPEIGGLGNGRADSRQQRSNATTARALAMSKLTARRCALVEPAPVADATRAASPVILLYVLMNCIVHPRYVSANHIVSEAGLPQFIRRRTTSGRWPWSFHASWRVRRWIPWGICWWTASSHLLQVWRTKPLRSRLPSPGNEVLRVWQACKCCATRLQAAFTE